MKDIEVNAVRTEPIAAPKMTVPKEPVDISELRETYRGRAEKYVLKLKRSVCKNYENPPSYEGYQSEIQIQKGLTDQIMFIQNCRAAIELALQQGKAVVDGKYVSVTFAIQNDGKILVTESKKEE